MNSLLRNDYFDYLFSTKTLILSAPHQKSVLRFILFLGTKRIVKNFDLFPLDKLKMAIFLMVFKNFTALISEQQKEFFLKG